MICTLIWWMLEEERLLPDRAHPKHLLWTLYYMKTYQTENVTVVFVGCDEKTLRKWTRLMSDAIADLDVVSVLFSLSV